MGRRSCKESSKTKKTNIGCESGDMAPKFSLPVLSDEPNRSECDYAVKYSQGGKTTRKSSGPFKVKIKCEALNIEKIIDYVNNEITVNKYQKSKKVTETYRTPRRTPRRTACNKKTLSATEKSTASIPEKNKVLRSSRKTSKNTKEKASVKNSKNLPEENSLGKKRKILLKETLLTSEGKSVSYYCNCTTQQTNVQKENFHYQANTSQVSQALITTKTNITPEIDISSTNLNVETPSAGFPCSCFCTLDDDSAFLDLNNLDLKKFITPLGVCCKELKMNSEESASDKIKKTGDISIESNILEINNKLDSCRHEKIELRHANQSNLSNSSLQTAVEIFMKNPQVKYLRGSIVLKKGLCFSWLSNNYECSNLQCPYSHNALDLFTKKLKQYPSKFIMSLVVSMRNDLLFVDVVLAAFKIISERKIPVVWVTFLTFFVFYVVEPSDSRFLKFWATAARFFCELKKTYSTACGFASLLSIFSQAAHSEEWKIIEFIKFIRQPPIQVSMTFTVLQPVLKMDLPSEFLTEAVESCITTQNDVLKVYSVIVPKISIGTSSTEVVELLLKLCKTLEGMNHKNFADDLKHRLRRKVLSFKTKVARQKYPLTASFQEEISNQEDCYKQTPELTFSDIDVENNYFQVEENFCNLMAQAMEHPADTIPSPYKSTEDICERQLYRIKQFFRDCQFDLLGKYLNELRPNVVERVAEKFLKLLFRMKISLQEGVDLIRIILLSCKSENAAKACASISITYILNLIRINEWEKAYTIVSLCQEKQINLVEGKVFFMNELDTVTQCRIVLLLIEIQAYKGNYAKAVDLVKTYVLFSPNSSVWQVTWNARDETIRARILEDLLEQIILNQFTQAAYDLFELIWKEQKNLLGSIDLRKFVNEILILLLNENREEAMNLYEQFIAGGHLYDTTVRAIVVNLVRRNRLSAAKSLVLSSEQNAYFIPKTTLSSYTIKVSSFWLEEEIYIVFSTVFDVIISDKFHFDSADYKELKIDLQESASASMTSLSLRPLCLGIIKSSFKDACSRIQRVLENQFNPPLKLIIMPYSLKLDDLSLQLHLHKRMTKSSG